MILDNAYASKGFYALNQVKSRPKYLSGLGIISLLTERLLLF